MTAPRRSSSPMVTVYDGRELAGFIIARGVAGHEAFTPDERTIGVFPTRAEAAAALAAAPMEAS
jgi:hypothetical protein